VLTNVFYISTAVYPRDHASNMDILLTSRALNSQRHLTGFLFRTDQNFMQFLEGGAPEINAVMHAIQKDPRHSNLQEWPRRSARERVFPDWSMGYGNGLNAENLASVVRNYGFDMPYDKLTAHLRELAAPDL